jgi:hypothetical protein
VFVAWAEVDDGLLPHAAASRARLPVTMMAAAVRILGGHGRDGRRMTRLLLFIMLSERLLCPASQPLLCWP